MTHRRRFADAALGRTFAYMKNAACLSNGGTAFSASMGPPVAILAPAARDTVSATKFWLV
jgi:hypothetical protein